MLSLVAKLHFFFKEQVNQTKTYSTQYHSWGKEIWWIRIGVSVSPDSYCGVVVERPKVGLVFSRSLRVSALTDHSNNFLLTKYYCLSFFPTDI